MIKATVKKKYERNAFKKRVDKALQKMLFLIAFSFFLQEELDV